jgi:hypothetical protein
MADEGRDMAVFGGNFDLLVDHGVSFRFASGLVGFLARAHRYDCKETGP